MFSSPPPPALAALALLSAGCSQWPRYAHIGEDTAALWPAGSSPHEAVSWSEGTLLAAEPGPAVPLSPGLGLTWAGDLIGAGFDPGEAPPQGDTSCGLSADFPPPDRGGYQGQSLWAVFTFTEVGTLCAAARSDAASLDLLLYDLSLCGIPQGPARDEDSGAVLGYGGGLTPAWSAPVVEGSTWGAVLSGYEPSDPALSSRYELALSLVERGGGGGAGDCEAPPWEAR